MAILLRAVGVPTRVINGFRGGEFNDLTGSYLVRGRDAHSWVEVYFPGNGWVTFDPTPAAPAAARGSFSRLMLYVDAAAEFWREWVINYDVLHQHTLQENATSRSRAAWERLRAWSARQYQSVLQAIRNAQRHAIAQPRKPATIAIALVLLAVLLFNLPRMVRRMRERRLLHHPRVEPRRASTVWYERMLRIMDRHGWRKSAHVTPAEFSRSIADAELRPILDRFTDCYEHARFGHSVSHAEQLAAVYEELARRV
jgi:hypothetical protein